MKLLNFTIVHVKVFSYERENVSCLKIKNLFSTRFEMGDVFNTEITKGYILKVIVEILCGGSLQRVFFILDKSGISVRQADQCKTILYDINLPRKNMKSYTCKKPMVVSINLKHLQVVLKNIKKKDSINMHINSKKPGKFFISVKPEGSKDVSRVETSAVVYQEEKDYELLSLPKGYKHPMVISSSDFQKVKRLTTIGKTIIISIQRSNYLSFKCDAGSGVYESELEFGKKKKTLDDTDSYESEDSDSSREGSASDDEDEIDEDEESDGDEDDESEEGEADMDGSLETSLTDDTGTFSSSYHSSILTKLVKLPGMCTQMQFYAPHVPQYPLKIESVAGQGGYILGTIQIFIKDIGQINYEATMVEDNEISVPKNKKKK